MSKSRLYHLIEKSLETYDNQNREYKQYINNKRVEFNSEDSEIIFSLKDKHSNKIEKIFFRYEVLGIFDNSSLVWIWSWMIPYISLKHTYIAKTLLQYGLKLEPSVDREQDQDNIFLKVQFVNSRFLFEDYLQLEIHLALSSYLSKNKFKFIFPYKEYINKEKTKYITVYYLVI